MKSCISALTCQLGVTQSSVGLIKLLMNSKFSHHVDLCINHKGPCETRITNLKATDVGYSNGTG